MIHSNDVFISYRRSVSGLLALAVYQELHNWGISAFYDIESIDSGQFDTIILNQIAARPYFLLILTAGTLERCIEPRDWLRWEIEYALTLQRVIIPLFTTEFNPQDIDDYLPSSIGAELKRYNGVEISVRFFRYAIQDLRSRFLKPIPLHVVPVPLEDEEAVQRRLEQISAEVPVTDRVLNAYNCFERALARSHDDLESIVADYTEAITLNPLYAAAFNNRGNAYFQSGDIVNAMADYAEAVRLDPRYAALYYTQGIIDEGKNADHLDDPADNQADVDALEGW